MRILCCGNKNGTLCDSNSGEKHAGLGMSLCDSGSGLLLGSLQYFISAQVEMIDNPSFRCGVALQPLRSHCSLPFSDGCSQTWTLRFLPYVDSLEFSNGFYYLAERTLLCVQVCSFTQWRICWRSTLVTTTACTLPYVR